VAAGAEELAADVAAWEAKDAAGAGPDGP
jgi:hypothetical protein